MPFTELARVQGSAKDPYVVSRNDATGEVSCTCPGWRFSGAKRGCKHTKALAVRANLVAPGTPPLPAPFQAMGAHVIQHVVAVPSTTKLGFMLAHEWDGAQDLTGWWVSEKLDGVRARWDARRRVFVSRQGNTYQAPAFFTEQMPPVDLDGELWLGRGLFNECSGICRRAGLRFGQTAELSDWRRIRYVVFDGPGFQGGFEDRIEAARRILTGNPYAMVHQFIQLPSTEAIAVMLKTVEAAGGEGLMARKPGDAYRETRTSTLLKVKSFRDAEAVVVAHEPGEGKHEGRMGALRCTWTVPVEEEIAVSGSTVEMKVGTGFTDKERDDPPPIGARITFRYFEVSKDGKPRFPSYVGVRDYE